MEDSGGAWHASEEFAITAVPAGALDTVSQAASGLSWSTFSPFSAGAFSIGGGSSPSLESVQSVGFFADVSGSIANTGMAMEFFQVTAVPEPSTLALLGTGLALMFAVRRRNSRK